jgi:hypothetical protein
MQHVEDVDINHKTISERGWLQRQTCPSTDRLSGLHANDAIVTAEHAPFGLAILLAFHVEAMGSAQLQSAHWYLYDVRASSIRRYAIRRYAHGLLLVHNTRHRLHLSPEIKANKVKCHSRVPRRGSITSFPSTFCKLIFLCGPSFFLVPGKSFFSGQATQFRAKTTTTHHFFVPINMLGKELKHRKRYHPVKSALTLRHRLPVKPAQKTPLQS